MLKARSAAIKIIFALMMFIFFGEFGLRLFKNQIKLFYSAGKTFPPIFTRSDYTTIKLKPNTDVTHYNYFNEFVKRYHINSKGLRGYTEDARVVMLGDSFIFGIGLNDNETVPYYLQGMAGIKVINAGVPGYSIDDMYILLQKYDPDIAAIVSFFLGNDIDDIRGHEWVVDEKGLPKKVIRKGCHVDDSNRLSAARDRSLSRLKVFLRDNSFFYMVLSENRYKLKWKLKALSEKLKTEARTTPALPPETSFTEDEYTLKTERIFDAMKHRHNKLLVLVISSREPDPYEAGLKKYMTAFFDREAIEYLCLPNYPGSMYYGRDCHWTPEGARHMASLIDQKLRYLCWL